MSKGLKSIKLRVVGYWFGVLLLIVLTYLSLGTAGLVSHLANKSLLHEKLSVEIDSIRYNPFVSTIHIRDVQLKHKQQEAVNLKDLYVELSLSSLLFKETKLIELVQVEGLKVAAQVDQGQWSLAGWHGPSSDEKKQPQNDQEESTPPNVHIDKILFNDLQVKLSGDSNNQIEINKWLIEQIDFNPQAIDGRFDLQSTVDQQPFFLSLNWQWQDANKRIDADVDLTEFNLDSVASFLPENIEKLLGKVSFKGKLSALNNKQAWQITSETLTLQLTEVEALSVESAQQTSAKLPEFNAELTAIDVLVNKDWQLQEAGITAKLNVTGLDAALATLSISGNEEATQLSHAIKGNLAYSSQLLVKSEGDSLTISQAGLNLDLSQINAQANINDVVNTISFEKFETLGANLSLSLNKVTNQSSLSLASSFYIDAFNWVDDAGDIYGRFDRLETNDLSVNTDNAIAVAVAKLSIDNITGSQVQKLVGLDVKEQTIEPLAKVSSIVIDDIKWRDNFAQLGNIELGATKVNVYRSTTEGIENIVFDKLVASDNSEEKVGTENSQTTQDSSTAVKVKLAKFSLKDSLDIRLTDSVAGSAVNHKVVFDTLFVENLDTHDVSQALKIEAIGRVSKRAGFHLTGDLIPFSEIPKYTVKGDINDIDLIAYSQYVEDAIGYNIKRGSMSAKVDFNLVGDDVKGEVDTFFRALELVESKKPHVESGAIPLGAAVDQLTDSQGNMEVDIPISGSFSELNIGFGGFISLITTKALKEGAKNYLLQTFVPYANVVSIAMLAGGSLFEIDVNDLPFDPGQEALNQQQTDFAKELSEILNKNEDLQLSVCAVVAKNERPEQELIAIGDRLHELFVDNVIEQQGVAHQRVIACRTEIDTTPNATNRLSFEVK